MKKPPRNLPRTFSEWAHKYSTTKSHSARLRVLANFLEFGGFKDYEDRGYFGGGFSIAEVHSVRKPDYTGNTCSTVCCIAGWAEVLDPKTSWVTGPNSSNQSLITPPDCFNSPHKYPPERCAAVIRHLAKHREVRWDLFPA